jgi:hypothetical protein
MARRVFGGEIGGEEACGGQDLGPEIGLEEPPRRGFIN